MSNEEVEATIDTAEKEMRDRYLEDLGGPNQLEKWRATGLLSETRPGSMEEVMLAILMNNQRIWGRSSDE